MKQRVARIKATRGVCSLQRQQFFLYGRDTDLADVSTHQQVWGQVELWGWGEAVRLNIIGCHLEPVSPEVEAAVLHLHSLTSGSDWPANGHSLRRAAKQFFKAAEALGREAATPGRYSCPVDNILAVKSWAQLVDRLSGATRADKAKMARIQELWYVAEQAHQNLVRAENECFGLAE